MIKNKKTHHKKIKFNFLPNINVSEEKSYIIENLSMLINAGAGIGESLEIIAKGLHSGRIKSVILNVKHEVEQGMPLWQALKNTKFFSFSTISLIKIGEQSGKLGTNLSAIAIQQQKDKISLSRIQSAMAYPVLVLSITFIVAIGIFWFVIPKLTPIFTQLNVKLPLITKIFISFSSFLVNYGLIFIPVFLIFLFLIIYFIFYYSKTRFIGQAFLFFIPGVRKLIKEVEISRFGYILGNLLSSGISVPDSLLALSDSTRLLNYKKLYDSLKKNTEEGYSFQKSFMLFKNINKLIPSAMTQMIIVGEQSGNLSGVFKNIGEVFEKKSDNTIKNLTVALEPILLIFVWFGVLAVALSVILPIYGLIGGMNNQISPGVQSQKIIIEENINSLR